MDIASVPSSVQMGTQKLLAQVGPGEGNVQFKAKILSVYRKEITTKEYAKSITNRNESLINKIENDLDNGKNGILFMRDDHGLQFSKDVEVFYVSTTIINSLQNWLGEELNKFMNPGAAEN